MKYEEITIQECLEKVNETLFLPDIQRPYVWKEDDICLLFDSICRDYPINTVLFWFLRKETLAANQFLKRLKFFEELPEERNQENSIDTSPLQRDAYLLAIDGQQRITSLYLSLKGNYKLKVGKRFVNADLYYNLDSGVKENDDGVLFEFKFFPQTNADVFIESIENKKTKVVTTKNWLRVKYIFSITERKEIIDAVKGRIKELIAIDITNDQSNLIFEFWMKLNSDKLINYYNEKTQDYDKVLDIFIRTNGGGEKLSYSDLLFSYIKLNWNEARDKFSRLLRNLNESNKYKFSHDFILKTILFIHAKEQENLKYSITNFNKDIVEDTKNNWETKLEPALKLTKDLIGSKFLLTNGKLITSYNALIPIVYYCYKFEKKGFGEEANKLTLPIQKGIREWLITSMLTGVFGGTSDAILSKAKKAIEEKATNAYFPKDELFEKFNEAKPALTLKITEDLISRASYNSSESYLILSLLYKNSVNLSPLLDDNKPQQDHIFSKKEMKDAQIPKEKINSIYNIRLVSASDNRIKSDESYADWSVRLGNSVSKSHFIPDGNWSVANFDAFLEARKIEFVNAIVD